MIRIPDLRLPAPFAALGARLPQWPASVALAGALNAAVRAGVLDANELAPLEACVLRVRVTDAGACASVAWRAGRFRAQPGHAPAALQFTAPASAYLQMLTRQEDPDTLFFHRRLTIEGDTELGLFAKNLLDRVELPAWLVRAPGAG